jgi:hypothetical protein
MGDKKAMQKCAVLHTQFLLKVDDKSGEASAWTPENEIVIDTGDGGANCGISCHHGIVFWQVPC